MERKEIKIIHIFLRIVENLLQFFRSSSQDVEIFRILWLRIHFCMYPALGISLKEDLDLFLGQLAYWRWDNRRRQQGNTREILKRYFNLGKWFGNFSICFHITNFSRDCSCELITQLELLHEAHYLLQSPVVLLSIDNSFSSAHCSLQNGFTYLCFRSSTGCLVPEPW